MHNIELVQAVHAAHAASADGEGLVPNWRRSADAGALELAEILVSNWRRSAKMGALELAGGCVRRRTRNPFLEMASLLRCRRTTGTHK